MTFPHALNPADHPLHDIIAQDIADGLLEASYGSQAASKSVQPESGTIAPPEPKGQQEPSTGSPEHLTITGQDIEPEPLDPKRPYQSAEAYIEQLHKQGNIRTLHHHRGDFLSYTGTHYKAKSSAGVKAELYPFIERHYTTNTSRINNIVDVTKALTHIPCEEDAPLWLNDRQDVPDADEMLAMTNGLLHLPTRELINHTPDLFCLNSLTFGFDPEATCPEWDKFLLSAWPEDDGQRQALQEWMGYLVSGQTNQQKIGLLVGPKRSGKGTIETIITALMGKENSSSPTLGGLATQFGMAPLIGKTNAIISDARLSGNADQQVIAERLLNTSGEDSQTIDRKHRDPWTGRLGTRFTVMSNELPTLGDASGALAGRFLIMMMTNSFYGREDLGLKDRLLAELPGIFNWALEGLDRLNERGRFIQPESSQEAVQELADLTSPISAFIRDRCVVEVGAWVFKKELFKAWEDWCAEEGRKFPGTSQKFGNNLRAAESLVTSDKSKKRMNHITGRKERYHENIALA